MLSLSQAEAAILSVEARAVAGLDQATRHLILLMPKEIRIQILQARTGDVRRDERARKQLEDTVAFIDAAEARLIAAELAMNASLEQFVRILVRMNRAKKRDESTATSDVVKTEIAAELTRMAGLVAQAQKLDQINLADF
ncbi:hypothetical protein [Mesorhizobium sp. M7A.F.Ce.TU.012.03.2.1]|uniref:hypothetical protein n=1 Tax=Mesorhizobium sp. M7A.F.Ce.TU.012.03.2.1 TaxID=2493681 RepID=UPI000FDA9097|nr:hypothetical protein [Mesorhizobium sp. M7A.F.Ce.TU.012.03.2.1]AZV18103.1 hypothetical protein EJ079_02825 [Mesorhizobium sp. M7A.F.Ce.TU.012.03.2.1]